MSVISLFKSGNLEAVKVALERGDLERMSCTEMLDFLDSVQRSEENIPLLTLMYEQVLVVLANKRNEEDRKMNEAQIKKKLKKEAFEKRQGRSAMAIAIAHKERKRNENSSGAVTVLSEEASVEKVKVKTSLRSKMSELEMEEERGKLAVASVIEEANKSSLARESRLKIVQEELGHLEEEIGDIEAAMESLMDRKQKIVEKQVEAEKEVKELEERRKDSEKLTAAKIKDWMEKIENVQEELKVVQQKLQLVEGRPTVSSDLEKFMERQVEELREELECPVCLEVATKAPIYKCTDDHIVCRYFFALIAIQCRDLHIKLSHLIPGSADQN